MKTASIREIRHDFSRILEWVTNGEEVAITRRREIVAHLVPSKQKKKSHAEMPDITARLQKVFGSKVISDKAMAQILEENRQNY
jgi:antitoxin (DNA-binding transcriptional repressor) of toxin-antitoxin stability system